MTENFEKQYPSWRKIIEQDDREIRRIERARERFERRENKKDLKALKRYEKELERGFEKNWL